MHVREDRVVGRSEPEREAFPLGYCPSSMPLTVETYSGSWALSISASEARRPGVLRTSSSRPSASMFS